MIAALVIAVAAIATFPAAETAGGCVVIELFTSEGCSSCPPADRLLGRLVQEDSGADGRMYPVTLPVDYWNRLGWVDPHSDPRFSARQRAYAAGLGSPVFTPAMVINGRTVVLGSDEAAVRAAIARGRTQSMPAALRLSARWTSTAISGRVELEPPSPHLELIVSLLQDGIDQRIAGGENSGLRLRHERVCRDFVRLGQASSWSLAPPADATPAACRILAYARDPLTGRIDGAAQIDFR